MSYGVAALLMLTAIASASGAIALDSTAGDYTLTASLAPWISYSNTASLWYWCAKIILFVLVTSVCTIATCNCGRRMYILFRPAADADITFVSAVPVQESMRDDRMREELKMKSELVL